MKSAILLNPDTLDAAINETIHHQTIIIIGDTPPSLIGQGFAAVPLCTSAKLLNKMFYDHGVVKSHLLRLWDLIANPHEIFQSEGHVPAGVRTAVVVLTPEKKGVLPIVIPVHGDKLIGRHSVNWVASMYAKDHQDAIVAWKARGLLLWPTTTAQKK